MAEMALVAVSLVGSLVITSFKTAALAAMASQWVRAMAASGMGFLMVDMVISPFVVQMMAFS